MSSSVVPRRLREAGTITTYQNGYHVVWKGSVRGTDSLHDPDGYRYGYYTGGKKTTENEAFWACTGQVTVVNQDGVRSSKRCTFVLHEVDGVFTPYGNRNHMTEPHLPKPIKSNICPKCCNKK